MIKGLAQSHPVSCPRKDSDPYLPSTQAHARHALPKCPSVLLRVLSQVQKCMVILQPGSSWGKGCFSGVKKTQSLRETHKLCHLSMIAPIYQRSRLSHVI